MTSEASRRFHLGDILTITTGRLVAQRHMEAVHDILDWMTGDQLFTHQLPRAMDECQPALLAQHPDLADLDVPEFGGDVKAEVDAWLAQLVARFGEYREVHPLDPGDHTVINPLAELAMNHPGVTVIPVVLPDEAAS